MSDEEKKEEKTLPNDAGKQPEPDKKPDAPASDDGKVRELEAQLKALDKQLKTYKEKEAAEIDKQKSAEQKLAEKEAELAKVKREALVIKVATKKGLDLDLVDRVRGDDEDAITADIDLLLTKFATPKEEAKRAPGSKTQPSKTDKTDEEKAPVSPAADWANWRRSKLA